MWPTASPVLHITRGFAIVRYVHAAHTTHENFFADEELKHTDSIDYWLDSLTNLMLRTRYRKEVAEDKMVCGLNKEIELE